MHEHDWTLVVEGDVREWFCSCGARGLSYNLRPITLSPRQG